MINIHVFKYSSKKKTKVTLAVINKIQAFLDILANNVEMSRIYAHGIFRQLDTDFARENFENFVGNDKSLQPCKILLFKAINSNLVYD